MMYRVLYDEAFLESNCDPLLFDESLNVDNTFWTYVTNYLILVICVFVTGLLFYRQGLTSVFAEVYFLFTGLGYGLAGVGHQITTSQDEFVNYNVISAIVGLLVMTGNAALGRIGIMFFTSRKCIAIVWAVINLIGIIVAFALAVSEPGKQALEASGLVLIVFLLPTGVAMIVIYSIMARKLRASKRAMVVFVFRALAFVLYLVGFVVQVVLGGVCGSEGYESCFEKCPLPDAANFNQNAIFHILVATSLVMLGVLEHVLPSASSFMTETAADGVSASTMKNAEPLSYEGAVASGKDADTHPALIIQDSSCLYSSSDTVSGV
jgi:hypothetical protein